MKRIALLMVAVAMVAGLVAALNRTSTRTNAEPAPQSAKEVRGATPYAEIENEPPPKLIVDPRFPTCWLTPPVSSGSNGGWRTCTSYRCSGRARSTYLHGSGICI